MTLLASATGIDLTQPNGASQVTYDGETVEQALNKAKALPSYSSLRSYFGSATVVHVTNPGIEGFFQRQTGVTPADNGGTVIVDTLGRSWVRMFSGPISVMWFGAVGDGITDDSTSFLAAFTYANSLASPTVGAEINIPANFTFGLSQVMRPTSNVKVSCSGWVKCLANPGDGFDCLFVPVNGASDVSLIGLKIDLNNIPAMNGFMFRTGNSNCWADNFHVKNGAHQKGGTQGGRGFQLESNDTGLSNVGCRITNGRVEKCYMGFAVQGGNLKGRSGFTISGITVQDCDVLYWLVGNTSTGYPHSVANMSGLISNIVGRNCGKNTQYVGQDAVIAIDRGCNIRSTNILMVNDPEYGVPDYLVRGPGAKLDIDLIYIGDCGSAVSFSPYKESDTVVQSESVGQNCNIKVVVYGTAADFLANNTTAAGRVVSCNLSGGATTITSKRACPANFIIFSSLHFDLEEQTEISRITGNADAVGALLFSAIPGRRADLDLSRTRDLNIRGDAKISSLAPTVVLEDLSASAIDGRMVMDAQIFNLQTETATGADTFQSFLTHNGASGIGRIMSGASVVFGWNPGYIYAPALGTYASDAAAATGGVPVGGMYKNGNIVQIRIV